MIKPLSIHFGLQKLRKIGGFYTPQHPAAEVLQFIEEWVSAQPDSKPVRLQVNPCIAIPAPDPVDWFAMI